MNGEQTQLVLQRLDEIHDDVVYLRSKQDFVREQVTEIRVDVSRIKGERAATKWVTALVIPVVVALVTTGIALAFAL
jgi:hypothetical protein